MSITAKIIAHANGASGLPLSLRTGYPPFSYPRDTSHTAGILFGGFRTRTLTAVTVCGA